MTYFSKPQHELDNAKIGDGITVRVYSDRDAYTVLSRSTTRITLQEDTATLLNGFDSGEPDALKSYPGGFAAHVEGRQRYSYERNSRGRRIKISRRTLKSGKVIWKQTGSATRSPGGEASAGRHKFHDYNF
jgi:hypothetical protein